MVRQLLSGKTAFLSIFSPCSFYSLKICGFEGFRGLHIIEQKNYLKSKREFCWFMKASPTQGREGVCFMDDLVPGNPTVLRVSSSDVSCFHSYQHFGQLSPPSPHIRQIFLHVLGNIATGNLYHALMTHKKENRATSLLLMDRTILGKTDLFL